MQHIKSKHLLKEPDCQETNETHFRNVAPPSQFANKESWRVLKKRTQISLLLQNVAGWDESKTYTSSVNSDGLDSTQYESAEKLRRLTWIARKKEFTTCKQCSFPFSSLAFLAKAGLIYTFYLFETPLMLVTSVWQHQVQTLRAYAGIFTSVRTHTQRLM